MEAIQALAQALAGFTGGVIVVSHDQFFIKHVCNEVWVVGGGEVKPFSGSFDEYKKLALKKILG
jgi:ATP-binding cassette subfamily F protein 3